MSNPAVITLVDGKLNDGSHLRIEDNLGESIHIHLNNITFYLSVAEFESLAKSFYDAAKELLSNYDIQLDRLDLSSLDWDWLRKYDQISSIREKKIRIRELYTIDKVTKNSTVSWRYVPIIKSKNYRALCGEKEVLSEYKEFNLYGQDSNSRLDSIVELLRRSGYPYDNKYIIVNQYGVIIDGAHRAAGLAYLHDENYMLPVIEFSFQNELPVDVYNRNEQKAFRKRRVKSVIRGFYYFGRGALQSLLSLHCFGKKSVGTTHHIEKLQLRNKYDEFRAEAISSQIRCFIIEKPKYNCQEDRVADCVLIVEEARFTAFKDYMCGKGFRTEDECYYDGYDKLYALDNPYLFRLEDKVVLAFSKLVCKSLTFDALIPVDSSIVTESWDTVVLSSDSLPEADITITMVVVILDALLEQRAFTEYDKAFISNHKDVLKADRMKRLLDKEFFSFTNSLIALLDEERFDDAISQYLLFRDY